VAAARSATDMKRRPWTSRKLACAWAIDTAATATSTTSTMPSWRMSSWPARETFLIMRHRLRPVRPGCGLP
jgi:hypothetical protein